VGPTSSSQGKSNSRPALMTEAQREQATASLLSKVSVPLVFGTSNGAVRRAAQKLNLRKDTRNNNRDLLSLISAAIEMHMRIVRWAVLSSTILTGALLVAFVAFGAEAGRFAAVSAVAATLSLVAKLIGSIERDRLGDSNRRQNDS
jgi:hypothetical protein